MRLLAPVPAKRGKNHVFISYAREDAATHTECLLRALSNKAITVWNDQKMRPGVPFPRALEQAIDQSFAMVALVSAGALESRWVRAEWCYAFSKRSTTIIPVVIPEYKVRRFPIELSIFSPVYLEKSAYDDSLQNVVTLVEFARDFPSRW